MTERLEIEAAGFDTNVCPDCGGALDVWAGEMGEQLECHDCGARFTINSVSWLERA